MEYKLDNYLFRKITISKAFKIRNVDFIAFIVITLFCILMRVTLFPFVSSDYTEFLEEWFTVLKNNGGFKALSISLGDYTPPYFYILAALTYLPLDGLISIKIISCIFDFILAVTIMKMIYIKYKSVSVSIFSYALTLCAPTILLNSSAWAQCDVIFTTFLVLCIFSFMKDKPLLGILFFSIAFSFKLQAIFIAPLLIVFWLKHKIKFRHFFIIPTIYIISIVPSVIAGRSFFELLTIYISQSGQYSNMSLNAPNLYMFISQSTDKRIEITAILICFVAVLVSIYLIATKKFKFNNEIIISLALFFSLLLPFLLPHMHERYFYIADVLSIVYAFFRPKKHYVSIIIIFSSFFSYVPFLFGVTPINLNYVSIIMLFSLIILINDIKKQITVNLVKNI